MTPHDVLLAVRDRIKDEKNWCQGWRLKLDGQCCILGAIDMARPMRSCGTTLSICWQRAATHRLRPTPTTRSMVPTKASAPISTTPVPTPK